MGLSPRSLSHAIRGNLAGPRLRLSRTPEGGRAMVFDAPARAVEEAPEAAPGLPGLPRSGAPDGADGAAPRIGGRFIDDAVDVGFRHGLVRAARDGVDYFVADDPRLGEVGPLETLRLDGPDGPRERLAVRFTPEVRRAVTTGSRLRFGAGDAIGRKHGLEPRDLILAYNDRMSDSEMALEFGIDPEVVDAAQSIRNRLTALRHALRETIADPERLSERARTWNIDEAEIRDFVTAPERPIAERRRTPALRDHLREQVDNGVTETAALIKSARDWLAANPNSGEPSSTASLRSMVAQARGRRGLTREQRPRYTPAERDAVVARRRAGASLRDIAKETGLRRQTVQRIVERAASEGEQFPQVGFGRPSRLRFAPADDAAGGGREFMTNADGYRLLLPFEEKWGNPRFDEADRGAALARLQEIARTDWRAASWDEAVQAYRDIDEVIAQVHFWKPEVTPESFRFDRSGDDFRRSTYEIYLYLREMGGYAHPDGKLSMLNPRATSEDPAIAEIGANARAAVDSMRRSRRAGMESLLWHGYTSRPRSGRDAPVPERGAPDRAGFVSAVRRAVEDLPDAAFARDPGALFNTIRKARNVTTEELDFMDLRAALFERGGAGLPRGRWTREDLLRLIDDRRLRMIRRNNEFNPERPTGQYSRDMGGTRAFNGPRVPGRGRYFEERFAFPKRRRDRQPVDATERIGSSHWEDGVWGSIRGSVREDPKRGRGILGEELQRDYYQAMNARGALKVAPKDLPAAVQLQARIYNTHAEALSAVSAARSAVERDMQTGRAPDFTEDPAAAIRSEMPLRDGWVDQVRRGDFSPLERLAEFADSRGFESASLARQTLATLQALRERTPEAFTPEAAKAAAQTIYPIPPLSNDQSTRMLVRALFTRAAREGASWVAIPTGATNDRIQRNTYASAAHYYDGELRNVLERVARDLSGGKLSVERTTLPIDGMKRGVSVYMVNGITPEMHAKIKEGLPLFGVAQRFDLGVNTREDVEAEVRQSWGRLGDELVESGAVTVVRDPTEMDIPEISPEDIPAWVGAVHDIPTGRTYIFSDRVSIEQVRSLVLHEVGVHHGLEKMVGKGRYRALRDHAVRRLQEATEAAKAARDAGETDIAPADLFWLRVHARLRRNYAPDDPQFGDELLAYVAEDADQALMALPEAHPDRAWWQEILDAVKRWFLTTFDTLTKGTDAQRVAALTGARLSARDIHTLAVAALGKVAQDARRARVAEGRVEPVGMVDSARVLRYAQARGFDGDDPTLAARWLDEQGYFSPAVEAVRGYPQARARRADMVNWLRNQKGVKKDELNTLFLEDFVEGGEFATREEFLGWVRQHRYETTLQGAGPDSADTSFVQWGAYTYLREVKRQTSEFGEEVVAPVGYWEAIITPRTDAMPGSRWDGSHMNLPGVIAHVRGADDVSVDGKPAALMIELQSDMWDMKPDDRIGDVQAIFRQLDKDVASLREHFGEDAVALWNQVRQYTGSEMLRATSEGPPDLLAMSAPTIRSWAVEAQGLRRHGVPAGNQPGQIAQHLIAAEKLDAEIRAHNRRAESLSDARTAENGGAFGVDPSDALRQAAYRVRGGLTNMRDERTPFRQTWPVKAFTDVVRAKIRGGATRIAWSTKDAVNSIPGMSGYQGDLYDVRVPRYAREWLGVEAHRGLVDEARTRSDRHDLDEIEELMPVIDLAINESAPDGFSQATYDAMGEFLQEQALVDGFFSEIIAGRMAVEDQQRLMVNELNRQWEEGLFDGLMEEEAGAIVGPEDRDQGFLRAFEQWTRDFVTRSVDEIRRLAAVDRAPPEAWYFDVTPEVRARALGPMSLFFGEAAPSRIRFGPMEDGGAAVDNTPRSVPDYRTRKKPGARGGLRDSGVAEAVIGNSLGASVGGVLTVVAAGEQGRAERKAEYDRLVEENRESQAQLRAGEIRREQAERLEAAIADRDWRALPALKPEVDLAGRAEYAETAAGWAEQMTGVPASFTYALIRRETAYTFRADIRPMRNGRALTPVVGFGQFMPDTWAGELMRSGAEFGVDVSGMTRKQIAMDPALQALREDPRLATIMVAVHARENMRTLSERLGRPVSGGEAYAAHFLGVDKAAQFIRDVEANLPAARMRTRYRREAADNPWVFQPGGEWRSAREVMADFTAEFGNEPIELPEDGAAESAD